MNQRQRNFFLLGGLGLTVLLFSVMGILKNQSPHLLSAEVKKEETSQPLDTLPPIGGAFKLKDQHGRTWTEQDLLGKPSLIYFGYTYCPDICPTALHNMTQAVGKIGKGKLNLIFVTVDPERDTQSQFKIYGQNYHPDFIMLTGNKDQIQQAIKAYRVYAAKVEEGRGKEDYLIDHSSIMYLLDSKAAFRKHFNHQTSPEEIIEGVQAVLNDIS